ncbi:peptidase domain-containing ABC transporter [Siphonobacter sp. SORGH_AS_1065]|uniref:peptidase domain-containing ABC transporter n=1 Tax=Siphonobacter sp. SORGH_AS_1065 TaxID=3041795 RepID=UPI0027845195|nr:peptidase domain-containing ABC transporter [Siphonobacter sp. SORGH_AS_1065]MDQ1090497.1 ATP-binding cassette subfamily B protein [Siphonobacter sp. SORGH_AS_1065]
MFFKKKLVFCRQFDAMDCGAACLNMISSYYGKRYELPFLRNIIFVGREGCSLLNLSYAAENIGMSTFRVKLTEQNLVSDCPLPCILHWNSNHYVVLYKVKKNLRGDVLYYKIADPAYGIIEIKEKDFKNNWCPGDDSLGIALLLEPNDQFSNYLHTKGETIDLNYIFKYLKHNSSLLIQLILLMAISSIFSLLTPFMTQILVDYGVNSKNIDIVNLILYSQVFLYISSLIIQFIQNWILIHVNTRISLGIISDFLNKLLCLPIRYFDSKTAGDITQRINDHKKVEEFLTSSSIITFFSVINIIILSIILILYSKQISLYFWILTSMSIFWVFLFQGERKNINYKQFKLNKDNKDLLNEIIFGMQEIKLYGAELIKIKSWQILQANIFYLGLKGMNIENYQRIGYVLLNHIKNIIITYIAAKSVINNDITLGMLLSISYIVGQTSGPIEQLISFIKLAQDATLSIRRMNEIHSIKNENQEKLIHSGISGHEYYGNISIDNVSFQYEGPKSKMILKNINVKINRGTVTAIVGESGSGKSTLLKLLLGYYKPTSGNISIGSIPLSELDIDLWRKLCGVIMQEGYIFNDSILQNIILGNDTVDLDKLEEAVSISNVDSFVKEKPLKYDTKIGSNGSGLSGGQKQRILIARAIYRNPSYIFFDEATSNLDANNESDIMKKLNDFFINRTVVVIAHRLSTVKSAHQIIVMKEGQIVEKGNHVTLVNLKGHYYNLVKNQLELDS